MLRVLGSFFFELETATPNDSKPDIPTSENRVIGLLSCLAKGQNASPSQISYQVAFIISKSVVHDLPTKSILWVTLKMTDVPHWSYGLMLALPGILVLPINS